MLVGGGCFWGGGGKINSGGGGGGGVKGQYNFSGLEIVFNAPSHLPLFTLSFSSESIE